MPVQSVERGPAPLAESGHSALGKTRAYGGRANDMQVRTSSLEAYANTPANTATSTRTSSSRPTG
jgi:hypothetical protein